MNEHFRKRLQERHELLINKKDFYQLNRVCKSIVKKGLGKKLSNTRNLVMVNYKGKNIYVIYSKNCKSVITALPERDNIYISLKDSPCKK